MQNKAKITDLFLAKALIMASASDFTQYTDSLLKEIESFVSLLVKNKYVNEHSLKQMKLIDQTLQNEQMVNLFASLEQYQQYMNKFHTWIEESSQDNAEDYINIECSKRHATQGCLSFQIYDCILMEYHLLWAIIDHNIFDQLSPQLVENHHLEYGCYYLLKYFGHYFNKTELKRLDELLISKKYLLEHPTKDKYDEAMSEEEIRKLNRLSSPHQYQLVVDLLEETRKLKTYHFS